MQLIKQNTPLTSVTTCVQHIAYRMPGETENPCFGSRIPDVHKSASQHGSTAVARQRYRCKWMLASVPSVLDRSSCGAELHDGVLPSQCYES